MAFKHDHFAVVPSDEFGLVIQVKLKFIFEGYRRFGSCQYFGG
jgi:hypothetical protein